MVANVINTMTIKILKVLKGVQLYARYLFEEGFMLR